ncbi:acyltransferase family protein [Methylosinus sp. Sm6]|uniref:acyltransferase family protein n=1 Tax=Methylosinus sp. Sm6 TaxID=2866948 RepID=UPI001C99DE77|nr:acyltransferase family protein [Methylosinus sp. Sm6]MBY6242473.1 acyltransferase [Methylosinus sp. Sm6]
MKYRPEIDGLRALAIFPVIFFHSGIGLAKGGFVGVDVFFVISGYLITTIIISDMESGRFSILEFYERRARRILPALFFVMAASLPFAWLLLLPGDMKQFLQTVIGVPLFVSNIVLWRESGYFDVSGEMKPLLHTWSLSVEEQFYILYPAFLLLSCRLGKRFVLWSLAAGGVVSLLLAHWAAYHNANAGFFLLPTRAWELILGCFSAFYLSQAPGLSPSLKEYGGVAGLSLVAISILFYGPATPYPGIYALAPTLGALFIVVFATRETCVGRLLSCKLMTGVGVISYSAYLWHQPIFAFARYALPSSENILVAPALVALVFLSAFVSWRLVEQPFRDRSLFDRKSIFMSSSVASAAFIGFGVVGYHTNGFASRLPEEDRALGAISKVEAGKYVEQNFSTLLLRNFSRSSGRLKVMLIGDSFAEDIANAVLDGTDGLKERIELSTFHISHRCGNLYVEDILLKIADEARNFCLLGSGANGGYRNEKLRGLLLAADVVWIASAWQAWQAPLVARSVANLKREFGKPVVVFGTKTFGEVDLRELIRMKSQERLRYRSKLPEEHLAINRAIEASLRDAEFIDVNDLLCRSETSCGLFTEDGKLLSYDGSHLTIHGARYLGERLASVRTLRDPTGVVTMGGGSRQ